MFNNSDLNGRQSTGAADAKDLPQKHLRPMKAYLTEVSGNSDNEGGYCLIQCIAQLA